MLRSPCYSCLSWCVPLCCPHLHIPLLIAPILLHARSCFAFSYLPFVSFIHTSTHHSYPLSFSYFSLFDFSTSILLYRYTRAHNILSAFHFQNSSTVQIDFKPEIPVALSSRSSASFGGFSSNLGHHLHLQIALDFLLCISPFFYLRCFLSYRYRILTGNFQKILRVHWFCPRVRAIFGS